MNHDSQKFAELIIKECEREVSRNAMPQFIKSPTASKFNKSDDYRLEIEFGIMMAGVFVLLIGCVLLFDGLMAPAMWKLTSMVWLIWRIFKFKL